MKKTIIAFLALFVFGEVNAQDPEFTQFYYNPIYLNPALTGEKNCEGRSMINWRNQWPSLPGSFVTMSLSADYSLEEIKGGIGMTIMRDVAGEGLLTTTSIGLPYSYRLQLDEESEMRFGIEPQFIQRTINFEHLRFADQIQGNRGFVLPTSEPLINDPINILNLNTGVVFQNDKVKAGVAVYNITEPTQSFYGDSNSVLPRRYSVHASYKHPLFDGASKNWYFQPTAVYMQQNKFTQLNATAIFRVNKVVTGLGWRQTFGEFRNADAALFMLGLKYSKFRFAYSADMTVSDARSAAPWSHEISLMFTWCSSDNE